MPLDFELKLDNKNAGIQRFILEELRDQINKDWSSHVKPLTLHLRSLVRDALRNSPEYASMKDKDGKLRIDLGIEDTSVVDGIVDIIIDQTTVQFDRLRVSGQGLAGGFKVYAVESNWKEVLSSPLSSYTSVGADGQSVEIPFMKYLLLKGNAVLVKGYYVNTNIGLGKAWSRTGHALMQKKAGSNFQIQPANFSGTKNDNWVTRALQKYNVWDTFENELHRRLFR